MAKEDVNRLFQGSEYPLQMYNNQPIIDTGFEFFSNSCDGDVMFDYPNYFASYFRIFNERLGKRIKNVELHREGYVLYFDEAKLSLETNGNYYYEVVYIMAGGYEIVLRFGTLTVI